MTPTTEWIEDEGGFLALAGDWERLAEQAAHPFARHDWFRAFWESYPDVVPAVLVLRAGDELRGVLPLQRRGRSLHALANEHTPVFTPLAADEEALEALLDAAVAASPELVLPLPADHPATALLARISKRRGRSFWAEPTVRSPFVETAGTFEEYRRKVGRNIRKEAERRTRRLHDLGGRADPLVPPANRQEELEEGLRLEASGWKGERGTAILSDPEAAAFYRRVAELFDAEGRLVFSTARVGDDLIAFCFTLLDFDRAWTLKVGIDEGYRHVAPGIVLNYLDIKAAYEQGLDVYEMLGDLEPWKQRFMSTTRDHVLVRCFARRPAPVARTAYRRWVRPPLKRAYGRLRRR